MRAARIEEVLERLEDAHVVELAADPFAPLRAGVAGANHVPFRTALQCRQVVSLDDSAAADQGEVERCGLTRPRH
jgi:hypothetical protein